MRDRQAGDPSEPQAPEPAWIPPDSVVPQSSDRSAVGSGASTERSAAAAHSAPVELRYICPDDHARRVIEGTIGPRRQLIVNGVLLVVTSVGIVGLALLGAPGWLVVPMCLLLALAAAFMIFAVAVRAVYLRAIATQEPPGSSVVARWDHEGVVVTNSRTSHAARFEQIARCRLKGGYVMLSVRGGRDQILPAVLVPGPVLARFGVLGSPAAPRP